MKLYLSVPVYNAHIWHIYTLSELALITEVMSANPGSLSISAVSCLQNSPLCLSRLLIARGMKEESCLQKIYGWEKSHSVSSCPPKPFGKYPHRVSGALFQSSIQIGRPHGFLGRHSLTRSPCRMLLRLTLWKLLI